MKLTIYDSKELNFVELNYAGGNDTFIRCDKESKYIDGTVFNIFATCFESANKLYEYYGPTKYNARKLIPLRNALIEFLEKMKSFKNSDDFKKLICSDFLGKEFIEALEKDDPQWEKNWKNYLGKLIVINEQLIRLAELCAYEEKILWVVGY